MTRLVLLPDGKAVTATLGTYELNLLKLDSLSRIFGIIFILITFIGGVYGLHNRSRLEQLYLYFAFNNVPEAAPPAAQRPRAKSRPAAPHRPAAPRQGRAGPHSAPRNRAGARIPRVSCPGRGVVGGEGMLCQT